MLVTLSLISCNIYSGIDAPKNRKTSFIEIWMIIAFFPMATGLIEYGIVLTLDKYRKDETQYAKVKPTFVKNTQEQTKDFDDLIKNHKRFIIK